MIIYTPFLKLKQNELQAIGELSPDVVHSLRPLYDVPRTSKNLTDKNIIERIQKGAKELKKLNNKYPGIPFYLDNYDLDDTILLNGHSQYGHIIRSFHEFNPIPIAALNRVPEHNEFAIQYAKEHSKIIAVRLQKQDIESFKLSEKELREIWKHLDPGAIDIHVLLDFRHLTDVEGAELISKKFLSSFKGKFHASLMCMTGSPIPANITELVATGASTSIDRPEFKLWSALKKEEGFNELIYGDYGVISPEYSDAELDPRILRQVSTPKVFYSYGGSFFVSRGYSLDKHPNGNGQFFTIADEIVEKSFYRKSAYSFGDKYVFDRSYLSPQKPLKAGSQGSWIKAMTAAHITFISRSLRTMS